MVTVRPGRPDRPPHEAGLCGAPDTEADLEFEELLRDSSLGAATAGEDPGDHAGALDITYVRALAGLMPEPVRPGMSAEVRAQIQGAQAGEAEAFGRLYDRYVDAVFQLIEFRVGDRRLAEDLTTDTFLRALRRIGRFTWRDRDFGDWLATIAHGRAVDHLEPGRRAEGGTPLVIAVKQLDPAQQECILLRFLQGYSVAETAQAMGRSEREVRTLQRRAVQALAVASSGRRRFPARKGTVLLIAEVRDALRTSLRSVVPDPEFRLRLRAMLVATAELDGLRRVRAGADAAQAGEPDRPGLRARIFGKAGNPGRARNAGKARMFGKEGRRLRARGAIVIGVAAGAMAVSGISAATETASPGDALYGVKRSTERAQLAMAGSDVTRGQLSLDFARTRLTEATALPGAAAEFGGVLDDMDADTRKGVELLTRSAVARLDEKPLDDIDAFVGTQRQTLSATLDDLSQANRERAEQSLTLMEAIGRRSDELSAAINCPVVSQAGSDSLGPKLRTCSAPTDGTKSAPPARTKSAPTTGTKSAPTTGTKPALTKPAPPDRQYKQPATDDTSLQIDLLDGIFECCPPTD